MRLQQHALIEEAEPSSTPAPAEQGLTLNSEQADALQQIIDSDGQFARFLLDGITGSGKTEVYLQPSPTLANGKQALVLVPEIGLTPQTPRRFEQRFPGRVRSLHSGLSERQRWHNWQAAREGRATLSWYALSGCRPAAPGPGYRRRRARQLLQQRRLALLGSRHCRKARSR